MDNDRVLHIIAGCNGSGKTTAFRHRLANQLGNPSFVNPDIIAKRINPNSQWEVRSLAARETIAQIHNNIENGLTFAVETTLASRTYLSTIREAHEKGYRVCLYYFWLESAELSFRRVCQRAREGAGDPNVDNHFIPEEEVKRRYPRSVNYLFNLYMPIVDSWELYDNSLGLALLIADSERVYDNTMFDIIRENDSEKHVAGIHIDSFINQMGIRDFSEKVLRDKKERGESVVYSVEGKIVEFSPLDVLWLYDSFQRNLQDWEIDYLRDLAERGEDVDYGNGLHFPASMVLKLYGKQV